MSEEPIPTEVVDMQQPHDAIGSGQHWLERRGTRVGIAAVGLVTGAVALVGENATLPDVTAEQVRYVVQGDTKPDITRLNATAQAIHEAIDRLDTSPQASLTHGDIDQLASGFAYQANADTAWLFGDSITSLASPLAAESNSVMIQEQNGVQFTKGDHKYNVKYADGKVDPAYGPVFQSSDPNAQNTLSRTATIKRFDDSNAPFTNITFSQNAWLDIEHPRVNSTISVKMHDGTTVALAVDLKASSRGLFNTRLLSLKQGLDRVRVKGYTINGDELSTDELVKEVPLAVDAITTTITDLEHAELRGGTTNRSHEGVCDLSSEARHLLETDCNILPAVTEGANFEPVSWIGDEHGGYLLGDDSIGINGDTSKFSPQYQAAFKAALSDPIVGLIIKKTPLDFKQIAGPLSGGENAFYNGATGRIEMDFLVDSPSSIYTTWGAIRGEVIHEGTHGLYDQWTKEAPTDPVTQKNLGRISELWQSDMGYAFEEFRQSNGKSLSKTVAELKQLFITKQSHDHTNTTLPKIIRALDTYATLIATPNGLSQVQVVDDAGEKTGLQPSAAIARMAGSEGFDEYFDTQDGRQLLANFNKGYKKEMQAAFSFTQEGSVLKGVVNEGGHVYENANERVASSMSTVQLDPEGVVSAVNKLQPERRLLAKQFYETLYSQLQRQDPAVAKLSNLQYVITHIG